jgi:acylphosphatase
MDSGIAHVRGHVRGHVQGVGFRYFVRSVAHRHGLSGYVLNLADGRVEFLLQGETDHIEKVIEQIRSGPPHARVDEVSLAAFRKAVPREAVPRDTAVRNTVLYDGFEIR